MREQRTLTELWDVFNQESPSATGPVTNASGVDPQSDRDMLDKQERDKVGEDMCRLETGCDVEKQAVESENLKKKKKKIKSKETGNEKIDDVDNVSRTKEGIEVVETSNGLVEQEKVVGKLKKKKRKKKGVSTDMIKVKDQKQAETVRESESVSEGHEVVGCERKRKQTSAALGGLKKRKKLEVETETVGSSSVSHKKKRKAQ